jgi:hypothetical protein
MHFTYTVLLIYSLVFDVFEKKKQIITYKSSSFTFSLTKKNKIRMFIDRVYILYFYLDNH